MTPERKEEIKKLCSAVSGGTWVFDKYEQIVMSRGELLFALQGARIPDRNFILKARNIVYDLLAALEEAEHLLTDHGPNGRNYTNEQYVTLQQENGALRRGLTKEACTNASHARSLADAQLLINEYRIAVGNCYSVMSRRREELAEAQQTIARQRDRIKTQDEIITGHSRIIARYHDAIFKISQDTQDQSTAAFAWNTLE